MLLRRSGNRFGVVANDRTINCHAAVGVLFLAWVSRLRWNRVGLVVAALDGVPYERWLPLFAPVCELRFSRWERVSVLIEGWCAAVRAVDFERGWCRLPVPCGASSRAM